MFIVKKMETLLVFLVMVTAQQDEEYGRKLQMPWVLAGNLFFVSNYRLW